MKFQTNFKKLNEITWFYLLCMVAVLSSARIIFIYHFVATEQLADYGDDIYKSLLTGLRFDIKAACISFLPLFLIGVISASAPPLFKKLIKICPYYTSCMICLAILLSSVNYYYYASFGNHIDVYAYSYFNSDIPSTLTYIVNHFPVAAAILLSLSLSSSYFFLAKKLSLRKARPYLQTAEAASLIIILSILSYALLARGSLGQYPLKRIHSNISDHQTLNIATVNPFISLEWAYSDYKNLKTIHPIDQRLLESQMRLVLGKSNAIHKTPTLPYLEQKPPHVVLAIMEGMGMNVLIEDDFKNNDLLGSLRAAFTSDFVFYRFLSGASNSLDSLMTLLFHANTPTLSANLEQAPPHYESVIQAYKKNGYDVIFISAGNGMWGNLAQYLPKQGFDRFYDENTLKKTYAMAKDQTSFRGVPDEYAYKFARKLLLKAKKPNLIIIQSSSNQSPFSTPNNFRPLAITASYRIRSLMGSGTEKAEDLLQAYQYANNALGDFIAKTKNSSLGKKTIIAATGNHTMRTLDKKYREENSLDNAVPFYLYIPSAILINTPYHYEPSRIGSHRDIFPTLYHYSLSNTEYLSLGGENLLSTDKISNTGYHSSQALTAKGTYNIYEPEKLFPWDNDGLLNQKQAVRNYQPKMISDYTKLQDYFLRSQVSNSK